MARLTPTQALARLQPQGKARTKGQQPLALTDVFGRAEDDLYVFSNDHGGILTPALDTLPPILGSWEGESCELPPSMVDWLAEYAQEVEWVELMGDMPSPQKAKSKAAPRQDIPTMLATKWSQTSPYNDYLTFDGKKCVTGCNCTAAAQIIYYWGCKGFHRGSTGIDAYITKTNGYNVFPLSPVTTWDYKNLAAKPTTAKQKEAVARMMEVVGKAFRSDYTPKGTSAKPTYVAEVMRDNLRMGNGIHIIYASKGASTWEASVYAELAQGRPVMMSGWKGGGTGGHTFVCDGYDAANDLYHFNWGWGGSYNGWFAMSALNPTASTSYNSSKLAIIGIQPDYKLGDINGDGEVNITDAMQVAQDAQSGKYDVRADINGDGQVTITDAQLIIDKILGKIEL